MRKLPLLLLSVLCLTTVPSLAVNSSVPIQKSAWKVQYVDSQETVCGNLAAQNAIDGNASTRWQTTYCGSSAPLPHEIQVDLGASYSLTGFRYLPRQDFIAAGRVKNYEFYTSTDGSNWGTPVVTGILISDPTDEDEKEVLFSAPVTARYVRFRALSEVKGGPWTSMAELNVLQVADPNTGGAGSFSVTANPPSINLLPGGSTVANLTTSLNATFNNPISFMATGQPLGVAVSLSSPTIAAPGQGISMASIVTAYNATPGNYPITITANGGGVTQTIVLPLTISAPVATAIVHPVLLTSDNLATLTADRLMPLMAVGTLVGLSQPTPSQLAGAIHSLVSSLVINGLIPSPDLTCGVGGTCYVLSDYEALAMQFAQSQMVYQSMKFSSPIIAWVKMIVTSDTDKAGVTHWTDCSANQKCVFNDLQDLVSLEVDQLKDIQLGPSVTKAQLVQFLMDTAHVVPTLGPS